MIEAVPTAHNPGGEKRDVNASLLTAGTLVPVACAVALLHFGRPVLMPLALAGILTLTLAPLVRRLRGLGLAHVAAVFTSVGFVAVCFITLGAVLASQLADVVRELPQYRTAVATKLEQTRGLVLRPLDRWETEMAALWPETRDARPASGGRGRIALGEPIAVEIRQQRPDTGAALSRLVTTVGAPVGEAAVVLVLLLFMLLGRDSIRERVIRIAGEGEVARTLQALADTDERVSRFFATLTVVNVAFGAVASIALALLGVPHAILWGALAGLMRFVPYVGVPATIGLVMVFAAAVDPGWSLALWAAGALIAFDVLLVNAIEPHLYGHTTGLAPFGILVAALFWGSIWGPVGLIVSAPLTLCLVIAGRHVPALAPIAILFGESPGITRAFQLYERALAGEAQDVVDDARAYVRRHGLARYCDDILLPALALGSKDMRAGRIAARQDAAVRVLLVRLVESLRGSAKGRHRSSIVEASVGAQLRKIRESRHGPWQGSPEVPARSAVVLCAGLATERDELLTELLVRALRAAGLNARSVPMDGSAPDPTDKGAPVSVVLLMYPASEGYEEWRGSCAALRAHLPHAVVAAVRPPEGIDASPTPEDEVRGHVDIVLHSYSEALTFASRPPNGPEPDREDLAPISQVP